MNLEPLGFETFFFLLLLFYQKQKGREFDGEIQQSEVWILTIQNPPSLFATSYFLELKSLTAAGFTVVVGF